MSRKDIRVEKFYNGEYLGLFANLLVGNGWGSQKNKEGIGKYTFNHPNLKKIEVHISQPDIGLFGLRGYDVTITGPRKEINEFIESAKRNHEKAANSVESCDKQFRGVKEYKGLEKVSGSKILAGFIDRPLIRIERRSVKQTDVDIGYLKEMRFGREDEKSFWLVNGATLATVDSKPWLTPLHKIAETKYGHDGSFREVALGLRFSEPNFYWMKSDKTLVEIIERIQDGRSVSIS